MSVLGDESIACRRLAPDRLEVAPHLVDPKLVEGVEASGADGTLLDQAGLTKESKVSRNGGPADRQLAGKFADGALAIAQKAKDRAPLRVAEGVEWVGRYGVCPGT